MANNNLASGAVVITTSADKMSAGLKAAGAEVDAWGAKAQASMKASSAGISAAMSAAWEKDRGMVKAMQGGNWGFLKPKLSETELAASLNSAYKRVEGWADQTQKLIDTKGLDLGGKGGAVGKKSTLLKGLKLGELGELGLKGALAALGLAVAKAFDTHYIEQFNLAMDRSREKTEQLQSAIQKGNERRIKDLETAGPGADTNAKIEEQLRSTQKDIDAAGKEIQKLERWQDQEAGDAGKSLLKGLFGWTGIIGSQYEMEDAKVKEMLDAAKKRLEEAKRQRDALKELQKGFQPGKLWDPQYQFDLAQFSFAAAKKINEGTEAAIKAIREQDAKLGMAAGAAAAFDRRAAGETDLNKINEAALRAEANERKQVKLAIDDQIKAMEKQAATFGMTEIQAQRFDLQMRNATAGQLEQFDMLAAGLDRMKKELDAATPRAIQFAGAIEAGSQAAIDLDLRAKGFDFTSDQEVHKKNGEKIDDLKKELLRKIDDLKKGVERKLEGGV